MQQRWRACARRLPICELRLAPRPRQRKLTWKGGCCAEGSVGCLTRGSSCTPFLGCMPFLGHRPSVCTVMLRCHFCHWPPAAALACRLRATLQHMQGELRTSRAAISARESEVQELQQQLSGVAAAASAASEAAPAPAAPDGAGEAGGTAAASPDAQAVQAENERLTAQVVALSRQLGQAAEAGAAGASAGGARASAEELQALRKERESLQAAVRQLQATAEEGDRRWGQQQAEVAQLRQAFAALEAADVEDGGGLAWREAAALREQNAVLHRAVQALEERLEAQRRAAEEEAASQAQKLRELEGQLATTATAASPALVSSQLALPAGNLPRGRWRRA